MNYTLVIATLAVAAMLWSEHRAPRMEWFFKPLAATCFVVFAIQAGALETDYGILLLGGMILCWCGDVLLIPDSERTFVAGLASFLLGHVFYGFAFLQLPSNYPMLLGSLIPVGVLGVLSLRWLRPHLPPQMRLPVIAYIVVICFMLMMAASTFGGAAGIWVLVGAWGFAISDLSVARDQFVAKGMINRLWGIPLYFASQLILAWSVSLV